MKWAVGEQKIEGRDIDSRRGIPMDLIMQEHRGLVRMPQGRSVGVLNNQTFEALSVCSGVDSFHADVFIPQDEWEEKEKQLSGRGAVTYRRNGIVMNAELILFGPEALGEILAKSLGENQLFLQPPHGGLTRCPYRNPQSLSLSNMPEYMEVDTTDLGLEAALASRGVNNMEDTPEQVRPGDLTQLANLVADIDKLFDQVPIPSHQPIALPLPHQQMLSTLFP